MAKRRFYNSKDAVSEKINPSDIKPTNSMKGDLILSKFEMSQVDIIVAFHGQYKKVTRLIESIYRSTRPPFLLTLVDDGSKNKEFIEDIRNNTNINCIRLEKQVGLGAALEEGYKKTNFPWIVFMDSDCYVDNVNWLKFLGESMLELKEKGIKMVSARYPNSNSDISFLSSPPKPVVNKEDVILKSDEYLPLTCVLCHRELFPRIGGFIKPYPYGWYEDQELAKRMQKNNFKQAICSKSWINHDGMSTIKDLWKNNPEIKEAMSKNEEKCISDINSLKNNK